MGGFDEYAKEIIKLFIAAQIIVSGSQLLVQQSANKVDKFFIVNVIAVNAVASILYIKIAGLTDSLIWGMVFSTCMPILIAYNTRGVGWLGEILNILSIVIFQPLTYYLYKRSAVDLKIFDLNFLVVLFLTLAILIVLNTKKISIEIKKNYLWRSTEVALTQGVLLYFADKLLRKSTSDEIIAYWFLMQIAGGIIFLANSFSYSIINNSVNVGASKNKTIELMYKIGALSMAILLFMAIKTSHSDLYYGIFLIIQGVMKFPGYALLGQNKSYIIFKSNVFSFAFIVFLDGIINFDSFGSYVIIQIVAALTATLLTYFQLRSEVRG